MQELNIYGLWGAKQTAKGSPAAALTRRLVQVGGDLAPVVEDGSEPYSDGTKFGNKIDWRNQLSGAGAPVAEATPRELAWASWIFHGGEVTSAVTLAAVADTTLGSPNLTNVNPTAGWANGMTVTGAGIPAGTTIVSGAGTATMVMSANATATAAGVAITGSQGKTKHATQPLAGDGFYTSRFRRVGRTLITRQQFNDVRTSQLVIEGSTGQKPLRFTESLISIDPAVYKAADPAAGMPVEVPFLYTDGAARFKIDDLVFRGASAFTFTANEDLQPVYSDAETIHDFAPGSPAVGISVTCYLDADALAQYYKLVYGTTAPAADAKPLKGLPALGGYDFDLRARDAAGAVNGDACRLSIPNVKWAVPELPPPAAAGGAAEITLTGEMRKAGSDPAYTLEVDCGAAAFTS